MLMQIVCPVVLAAEVSVAVFTGTTESTAVIAVPVQVIPPLVNVGVIVKVTGMPVAELWVSVPLMLPVPVAAMPVTVVVLSLVQLNVVPATLPLLTIVVIGTPVQLIWNDGAATASGIGLTITVAGTVVPSGQPEALVGLMLNVTVTGALVVLVRVPMILPVPLAAMPVTAVILLRVQL